MKIVLIIVSLASASGTLAPQSNLPLDQAARAGNLAEVRRLLDRGADPNEVNKWGTTALTGACTLGADSPTHTEIVWKAEVVLPRHPNRMMFEALSKNGEVRLREL